MNEEEIRGKLLLPYLNDLGFDLSEISLEKSFTIRLGRSQRTIKGRSDILCKRNGKNLFIIELKNESISITQNDIKQGISYATALVDNIAPFTIITNGKTTKIFDSISKIELTGKRISEESSFWKNGFTLSTEDEIKIRYEALKNFISLSPENLKAFCEIQVFDRMGQIIGGTDNPYSKFVKKLYVQRKDLQTAFENFINSNESVFGLVGAAGVGKTNAICSLALQKLEDKFVFFYNAAIINSPLQCISQDMNIAFSSRTETDIVLKKLDELGRYANKDILIFIDAIDECTNPNITHELSEIALVAKNAVRVKFIISCKSNIWNTILKIKNKPTHLYDELSKSHNIISSLENPGFLLTDFTDEELNNILPLYQNEFGFKGQISKSLLLELRNGFFLKIFSEVYRDKEVPKKINDKELIKKYLKKSLEETTIGFLLGLRTLSSIGNIILHHEYSSWQVYKDEGLDVNHVLEKLNFSLDENIPEDLFTRNILIKSNNEDSYNISFYYSKIRDYIICYHTYQLDKLNDEQFYNVLADFYKNHIGKSALDFYLENANSSHLNTLIQFKKDKAQSYVIGYNSCLENNFKKFKEKFDPKTNGAIGIIIPHDLLNEDGYALFPLNSDSSDIIQYESLKDPFSGPYEKNVLLKKGINVVYGSNSSLMIAEQGKTIKQNVFKQLKEIIEKGKFNAYNSDILLMEELATILYYYSKKLGFDFILKDYYLPRFELIYPINLQDLSERIYKFRAFHYYQRNNTASSNINQLVEEAFKNNVDIPKLNVIGDFPPFEELFKIVNILLNKGHKVIEKHHLPYPDKSVIETKKYSDQNRKLDIPQIRIAQFSEEQAKLYIEKFFKHLETCYKEFVEYCFPTFAYKFPFYTTLPHEYFFYLKDLDILKWGMFGYRKSKNGETIVHFKESKPMDKIFEEGEVKILRGFSLDSVLLSDYHNQIKTVDKINTPKVDDFCIIRNWVYKLLKDDMRKLFEENGENI
ncbi:MAG: NTPase (NACHT family) [Bacteroidetes bacterium HGW-Bacteroidetes-6]|jgi:hypothetical protein|nr:MAG: NTPase (NACHT family) [Bacteroidetes bacterium HGW-Bacteroidetes-6]